jgi:hypothetical protein
MMNRILSIKMPCEETWLDTELESLRQNAQRPLIETLGKELEALSADNQELCVAC